MTDEEKIKEYEHQIELLKTEHENISKEQERLRNEWCEVNCKIGKCEAEINKIKADAFKLECEEGKHKHVKWKDIPENLKWELQKIEREISGGCNGDWYDGCRGCTHRCHAKAEEKFMKKYNIEKILL